MTVRLMSDGELSRLEVLRDLDQKRLTTEAARLLDVTWCRAYETSILSEVLEIRGRRVRGKKCGGAARAKRYVSYQPPIP